MRERIDPVVRDAWFPVVRSAELGHGVVQAATILDEDLVLWRGPEGVHAWRDLCIHRGVRLSLGQVVDGCQLRCAYHGWTYDEIGRCVRMPAHPTMKPPERARVTIHRAVEQGGLIWVSLGAGETTPPELEEIHDKTFRTIPCRPQAAAAGAPRLIENFLDVAHLPIVHEGTLGMADYAEIRPYEVELGEGGRPVARDIRIFQPNPEGLARAGEVTYEYGVLSPFCVYLRKKMAEGRCFTLLFAVSPLSEVSSLAWFTVWLNYGNPAEDGEIAAFQDRIFAQDQPIVASQRPECLPLDLAEELHLPSDRMAIAYRQYIRKLGLSFGTA